MATCRTKDMRRSVTNEDVRVFLCLACVNPLSICKCVFLFAPLRTRLRQAERNERV